MNVTTTIGEDEVTVEADGEVVGRLDREFFENWAARIDDDPESCLSACLERDDRTPVET